MSIFIRTNNNNFRVLWITFLLALLPYSANAGVALGPGFTKTFTPDTIGPGGISTLRFDIINGNPSPVEQLAFTDNLPAGVTIASPSNTTSTCGDFAILNAPNGGSTITFTNGEVAGSASCFITVDVTSSTIGTHTNTSSNLTSLAGTGTTATDDLNVVTNRPGFSKSFAPNSISLGSRSTLTFTIDNTLNASRVGNLDFTDNLPAGMVVADPANTFTDCISASAPDTTLTAAPGSNVIVLNANGNTIFPGFEVLPIGATCSVSVDVTATGIGMLDNVTSELLADFTGSGKASATLNVSVTPLALQKSFTNDPTPPGVLTTLEFTIDNFDRNFTATNIAFTDDLTTLVPALAGLIYSSLQSNDCGGSVSGVGTTTIGFSGGTLGPESSCSIRVSVAIPSGATPGSYTNTTSTVSATVDGSPVVGNMASDDLFVEPVPILTKEFLEVGTFAPDPIVNPGDDVILRFTITNTSTTSGATDIAFIDELTDGGPGTGFLPFPLSVTLPPVPDPPCGVGSSLGFVFPDSDRQGLSLTQGNLTAAPGAGATCSFDVTLTIPPDMAPNTYLNTTEEITATVDGATRTGNTASDTLTVSAAPLLKMSFTDDPVAPGDTVTLEFTLTHSANASADATGITFTDNLTALVPAIAGLTANLPALPDPPCGTGSSLTGSAGDTLLTLMGGSLSPGESCTFSVTLDVPMGTASGSYTNTTSGVSATVSGMPVTSSATSADLDVGGMLFTKEFLGDPAFPGKALTLRFTLENISSVTATGIGFTDSLIPVAGLIATDPALADDCGGTLTVTTIPNLGSFLTYANGSLPAGQTCNIDVEVTVPATASDGVYENFVNSVSYMLGTTPGLDGPAIDNLIVESDQLTLSKSFTDDPVAPGAPVTLEFTLTNLDPDQAATAIDFTDDLAATLSGLMYDSELFNDCGATITGTGTDMITVSGASLSAGGSCTIRVSLTVPAVATAGNYTNTSSTVTGMVGGFAVTGDPATDDLEVINLLQFSKSFDGPTTAAGTATLTFTITNPGINTATGIAFSDNLNAVIPGLIATSLPTQPCGTGSAITGTSTLNFSNGELPPMGGMCSFEVDVLVPAGVSPGTYLNTTSDLLQNGLLVSIPATANLTLEPPPTFNKAFAPSTVGLNGPNTVSTLTFTIDNTASSLAATALDFTDNLPAGLQISSTPNVSTTCTAGTVTAVSGNGVITYNGGSIASGATCTIQVDVVSINAGNKVNVSGDLTSTSGNSGTASDTLTVDEPAVITPPANINTEATGSTTAVALGTASVADDFSRGLTATPDNTGPFPLGTTTVTWSVTDSIGNTSTAIQTVTINDTTDPVVTPPADINQEATGPTTAVVLGNATVTDLVDSGLIATPNNPGPFPVGPTTVTWSATDLSSNIGTATQTVTIVDTTAPVISLNGANPLTLTTADTFTDPGATATDLVDGNVSAGISASGTVNTAIPATYTITYSVTDTAGNPATATRTVIVNDGIPPVVTPPANITQEATGLTTTVSLGTATVTDDVDTGLMATPSTTGPFPVGITTVTWTSTDNNGNVGSAAQTVTIADTTDPIVTAPADINQEATGPTTAVNLGTATVTDLVSAGLVATPDNPGPFPVGSNTVTWSATDGSNNTGADTQTVTIVDTTAPVVTIIGSDPIMLNFGDPFNDPGATATDLVDGDLTATISVNNPVNSSVAGSYQVTYSVTDNAGNTGSATRTVLVDTQLIRAFSAPLPSGRMGTLSFTSSDPDCTFAGNPQFPPVSSATIQPPATLNFVDGLINFQIDNCSPGAVVTLTMDYGQPVPANAGYWKQGNPWFQLPATVNGNTITFQIQDGSTGDADNQVNGSISDPGGAAFNSGTSNPVDPSDPTRPIPTLSEWMMMLLSMLLAGLAYQYRRLHN
ncbi:MAG: IPTL-CTERM sorting domain-containing protein [Gammaproteobacteria bacterium]|nr:IPTL-CTERM sorting domain-containing protein [Gammaproteobacteria bacterium]